MPNIQIRSSVFETNSSSSHSLTLGRGDLVAQPFTAEELRAGVVEFCVSDYNWEFYRYYLPRNKIQYLLTQVTNGSIPSGDLDRVTRVLREDNAHVNMLCEVVREYTGCDLLFMPSDGGIDHQSALSDKAVGLDLFDDAAKLKEFIFGADSCIQTGNDNSAGPWVIQTDRGDELNYSRLFATPDDDPVTIKMSAAGHCGIDFGLGNGGMPDEPMMDQIIRQGIVTHVLIRDEYGSSQGDQRDQRGEAVKALGLRGLADIMISPRMTATVERKAKEAGVEVTLSVPRLLAEALDELDPKGYRKHLMSEAKRMLRYWMPKPDEEATSHHKSMMDKYEQSIVKLGGKKALAAFQAQEAKKAKRKLEKKAVVADKASKAGW